MGTKAAGVLEFRAKNLKLITKLTDQSKKPKLSQPLLIILLKSGQ